MSLAEELLNDISVQPNPEGHIIIGGDRFITVPSNLKRLGVQYDHNMETVTFECPRYWDERDMSKMVVYINYMLSNGYKDRYPADNVRVDGDVMYFDWTISRNVTQVGGSISFIVCVMKTDGEGNEERHWNSELCKDCYISPGMETEETAADLYPDEVTQLLLRVASVDTAILYTEQSLTEEQKAQARDNIGAAKFGEGGSGGSVEDAVLYTEQDLTPNQKETARANIGAPDKEILLQETDPCVIDMDTEFAQGYLDTSTGNFIAHGKHRTSDFIELEAGVVYQCDIEFINNQDNVQTYATVGYYNADQSFSRWAGMPAEITRIALKNDEKYIRMWISGQQVNLLRMYPKDVGYEPVVTLNPNLDIPQLDREIERVSNGFAPYIHARRPIIAFILDGEYDRNATMEEIFSRHGMRIGFAPQYTTTFANNPKDTYLAWQEKGHEILAHGTYILSGDTYTDEQAKEYINASYTTFKGYGFDVHGFIGSSGKVDEKYLPTIKKYYDYAATENNHESGGSIKESCLFFGVDNPYNLWRYSVQRTPLEQCKAAVDRAMETGGLLLFMGHANSSDIAYLTDENVEALLTYIEQVGATVKTPYEAIKDYYSIRYEDIISAQS